METSEILVNVTFRILVKVSRRRHKVFLSGLGKELGDGMARKAKRLREEQDNGKNY